MQIMSKMRHYSRRRRSYVAALASLLLLLAQFALIIHNYGGESHPLGEVCQICVQLHASGHALPPTIPVLPVLATAFLLVVFATGSIFLQRRFEAARPRGPPLH
jgi:Protein of unknown function (DUF2946)